MGPRRASPRGAIAAALVAVTLMGGAACSSDSGSGTTATPATPVAPDASTGSSTSGSSTPGTTGGSVPVEGFTLTSSVFADGGSIPLVSACTNQGGSNESPPLAWSGVPDGTESLVLVVHDPDAPRPGGFTHLVTTVPTDVDGFVAGANADPTNPMAAWIGPCPPSGEHHYELTLYAFGPDVAIPADADKAAVDAVAPDALGTATLTGLFAHRG